MAIRDRNRPDPDRDPDNPAARLRGWYLLVLYALFVPFPVVLGLLALAWRPLLTFMERAETSIWILVIVAGTTSILCFQAAKRMLGALRGNRLLPQPDFLALIAILGTMILAMQMFDGL